MVTLPCTCSPNGRRSSSRPPFIPLCLTNSSVSCEASTDTCGANARNMRSLVSPLMFPPGIAGEAGRTGPAPPGESIEPFDGPAVGVTVPDTPGEPAPVGSDVVDWKRVERDALDRRYGRLVKDASCDLAGLEVRPLATSMFVSESESCGDCSGSSSVGVMRRARGCAAEQSATMVACSGHLYAGATLNTALRLWHW